MENKDIDKARKVSSEVLQSLPTHLYDEVKSCINELIEALEEATRWIPVSERLPKFGALALVRFGISNECVSTARHQGSGHFSVDFPELAGSNPTHWRPIDTPKATQLLEKYGKK